MCDIYRIFRISQISRISRICISLWLITKTPFYQITKNCINSPFSIITNNIFCIHLYIKIAKMVRNARNYCKFSRLICKKSRFLLSQIAIFCKNCIGLRFFVKNCKITFLLFSILAKTIYRTCLFSMQGQTTFLAEMSHGIRRSWRGAETGVANRIFSMQGHISFLVRNVSWDETKLERA